MRVSILTSLLPILGLSSASPLAMPQSPQNGTNTDTPFVQRSTLVERASGYKNVAYFVNWVSWSHNLSKIQVLTIARLFMEEISTRKTFQQTN